MPPVALVFIHDFNVKFDAAVRRTAQIAYDLHFEGTPILYSWPSEGKLSSYWIDEDNARQSATRFHAFLPMVLTEVGARTVHVIAHSIGNRVADGFGSNKSIITDLFQLLRNAQTPLERGLQSLERDGLPYWIVLA